jgi:hypothetical protein
VRRPPWSDRHVNDTEILDRVRALVAEEHELRAQVQAGQLDATDEQRRLEQLEASLDQCWDLLRQRRAKREAGDDPELARTRPVDEVEHYLQ